jgi:hypothetical protein
MVKGNKIVKTVEKEQERNFEVEESREGKQRKDKKKLGK